MGYRKWWLPILVTQFFMPIMNTAYVNKTSYEWESKLRIEIHHGIKMKQKSLRTFYMLKQHNNNKKRQPNGLHSLSHPLSSSLML